MFEREIDLGIVPPEPDARVIHSRYSVPAGVGFRCSVDLQLGLIAGLSR